ncbi:MAG: alpha-L-fucosidase [Phycisphaerales bacterium]
MELSSILPAGPRRGAAGLLAVILCLASCACSVGAQTFSGQPDNTPPAGFTALFSGTDLSGWKGLVADPPARAKMSPDELARAQAAADEKMRAHWKASGGVLVFDGKGDSLCTAADYRDFELYVDWKIEAKGDSGIYLRGSPQVQIWDQAVSNGVGSGGLYNNQKHESKPLVSADRPVGEWNTFHIIMIQDRVTVYLNGRLVTDDTVLENYWDRSIPIYDSGQIELQNHGNTLYFKNIYLREIPRQGAAGYAPGANVPPKDDPRMEWWTDARFGMFIHWGLYAIPAGTWNGKDAPGIGEWIMDTMKVPPSEYEKLAAQFNPRKFDAERWVQLAKRAGMKYIVITTKHHDGFCLFDSKYTAYDVMDATPFKRDIMKELSDACHKEGIKMCWYHSIMDWHHPDARGESFPKYAQVLRNQVKELLTNYGEIGVMWFDGEWIQEWTEPQGKALYQLCRDTQQNVIVNNRVGKGRQGMAGMTSGDAAGDFGTPEQEIPATGFPGAAWESCMTMNDTWGFKKNDNHWKSSETLIHMLIESASKGGNFLLNVGPTAEGEIPEASVTRLEEIGQWLDVNKESIYGTSASPFRRLPFGRATWRPGRLYLHVFDWPKGGGLLVPGLKSDVRGAWILGDPHQRNHRITRVGDDVVINVPKTAPPGPCTVVALDIAGELSVIEQPIRQNGLGDIVLPAVDATVAGSTARYEGTSDKRCIGFWTDPRDVVRWDAVVNQPAFFEIHIEYACPKESAGGEFELAVGENRFVVKVDPPTASWSEFRTMRLPGISIGKPGPIKVVVTPRSKPGLALMNLREVRLEMMKGK